MTISAEYAYNVLNLNLNRNRQYTSVVYYVDASGWGPKGAVTL